MITTKSIVLSMFYNGCKNTSKGEMYFVKYDNFNLVSSQSDWRIHTMNQDIVTGSAISDGYDVLLLMLIVLVCLVFLGVSIYKRCICYCRD